MTTPFIGEIQLFGFNFAPYEWAQCNGASLPVAQYSTLYALIGNLYGGSGPATFQLPNLAARAACSQGTGPGLSQRAIGQAFGELSVTLTNPQMPAHNHAFTIYAQHDGTKRTNVPKSGNGLTTPDLVGPFLENATSNTTFAANALGASGNNQPHENRQPFLAVNFCIALAGEYPTFG